MQLQSIITVYIENRNFHSKEARGKPMNYTYILQCADGTFYCGWTNCLEKRLKAHNQGSGAKYTRNRRPVVLAYYEEFATKHEAMRREAAIKKLTREQKKRLIAAGTKAHATNAYIII